MLRAKILRPQDAWQAVQRNSGESLRPKTFPPGSKYIRSTTHWHLPWVLAIYLYKDWITCCCSCWFSTFPESSSGWTAEFRHSVLGGGRGDWKNGSSDTYFQESILWAQFLYLLVSVLSCSVGSHSLWPHELEPASLLCPWDFPGKNTGLPFPSPHI